MPARVSACPVTLPNETAPPHSGEWERKQSFGNGRLWTIFWPYNVLVVENGYVQDDGSIVMKWPWWRGVAGKLRIEGRRLDKAAKPLDASVPDGYGRSGFQASGIHFPTEGCWEVTGRVGRASLRFVTLVVKASRFALVPES
jgi:hypothetical protein